MMGRRGGWGGCIMITRFDYLPTYHCVSAWTGLILCVNSGKTAAAAKTAGAAGPVAGNGSATRSSSRLRSSTTPLRHPPPRYHPNHHHRRNPKQTDHPPTSKTSRRSTSKKTTARRCSRRAAGRRRIIRASSRLAGVMGPDIGVGGRAWRIARTTRRRWGRMWGWRCRMRARRVGGWGMMLGWGWSEGGGKGGLMPVLFMGGREGEWRGGGVVGADTRFV